MWVRLWVSGKSESSEYRWFADDCSDEDLKEAADDWSSTTSQGRLNDYYRFGFERNAQLPPKEREKLLEHFEDEKAYAERMIKRLRAENSK